MVRKTKDVLASKMNDAQKKEMLGKHALHELRMFTWGIVCFKQKKLDKMERAILFENNLLHARCLNEFFCANKTRRYADNALACDFVKNPDKWNSQKLQPWQEQIHKRLAHLSTRRLDETDPELWKKLAPHIISDVIVLTTKFLGDLPPKFDEEKKHFAKILGDLKGVVRGTLKFEFKSNQGVGA